MPVRDRFDPRENPALRKAVREARRALLPEGAIQQVILYASQGYTGIEIPTYAADWDSDAYLTVSGQNSNNTVRVSDDFMQAVLEKRDWQLIRRTDGKVAKTLKADELWGRMATAAWASADPGIQYDTTINDWHTCPADGRINASNPCSEYMFLDDTACNLASLNLICFRREDGTLRGRRVRPRRPAVDDRARDLGADGAVPRPRGSPSCPTASARSGLGYANLGGLLMASGLPYDSDAGRAVARRDHRPDDRHRLQGLGRDGGGAGSVPGLCRQPGRRAARAAQPSPRRLERDRRLRGPAHAAGPARRRPLPGSGAGRRRPARPGTTRSRWPSGMACATPRSR